MEREYIHNAFLEADVDGDGFVTYDELVAHIEGGFDVLAQFNKAPKQL